MSRNEKFIVAAILFTYGLYASIVANLSGKLQVQEGAVHYTLPIPTPKGAFGLKPSIALSYRQGSADGTLGAGFALQEVRSISRCGAKENRP